MSSREFLKVLYNAVKFDKRFDAMEYADKPGSDTIRIYPFDGPPLIITVRKEA